MSPPLGWPRRIFAEERETRGLYICDRCGKNYIREVKRGEITEKYISREELLALTLTGMEAGCVSCDNCRKPKT